MRRLVSVVVLAALAVPALVAPTVAAPSCDGREPTIVGTTGGDLIRGTSGPDVILAKGGDDVISGRGGRDRICGGFGNDDIFGGAAGDRLFGGSGHDVIEGGPGNDRLVGFKGRDTLRAGEGDDVITGGDGIDLLFGDGGRDRLLGGADDDELFGGDDQDELDGGPGEDRCLQEGGDGRDGVDCRADFLLEVTGPESAVAGEDIPFDIVVHNVGPDVLAYEVRPTGFWSSASCTFGDFPYYKPPLDVGAQQKFTWTFNCEPSSPAAQVRVEAELIAHGVDPDPVDNEASSSNVPIDPAP